MEKFLRTKYGMDSPAGAGAQNIPKKEDAA
jgi:hypothetical protein